LKSYRAITAHVTALFAAATVLAGCGSAAQLPAADSQAGSAATTASAASAQPASAAPSATALASPPSGWGAQPARHVTPGAGGSSFAAICPNVTARLEKRRPSVTVKAEVYAEYGILAGDRGLYRIDHLVPLELDGSNSIRNLWPQPVQASRAKDKLENAVSGPRSSSKPRSAGQAVTHASVTNIKDVLENRLHRLVCQGKVPLAEAQIAIARNWIAAYERWVGPLP
jgi:hypothetical protein